MYTKPPVIQQALMVLSLVAAVSSLAGIPYMIGTAKQEFESQIKLLHSVDADYSKRFDDIRSFVITRMHEQRQADERFINSQLSEMKDSINEIKASNLRLEEKLERWRDKPNRGQ